MSTLNLTPNPVAVVAQAVIFFTNLFIVKKLMLEPFLRQKAQRDAATTGSQNDARGFVEASDRMTTEMTQKIQKAHEKIRAEVDIVRKAAAQKKQEVVGMAEKQAKEYVHQIQVDINKGIAEERAKLTASARLLAGQLLDKALN